MYQNAKGELEIHPLHEKTWSLFPFALFIMLLPQKVITDRMSLVHGQSDPKMRTNPPSFS